MANITMKTIKRGKVNNDKHKIVKRLEGRNCKLCEGDGVMLMFNINTNKLELERCDTCCMFKNDTEAWKSVMPQENETPPPPVIRYYQTQRR